MSQTTTPNSNDCADELTDEERDLFERIAEKHQEDDEVRRICELVLHSDFASDKEVTNS